LVPCPASDQDGLVSASIRQVLRSWWLASLMVVCGVLVAVAQGRLWPAITALLIFVGGSVRALGGRSWCSRNRSACRNGSSTTSSRRCPGTSVRVPGAVSSLGVRPLDLDLHVQPARAQDRLSPLPFPRSVDAAQAQQRSARDGRPIVYWRPGCRYRLRLRLRLGRSAAAAYWVNIWRDPLGAAALRAVTGGEETVPTVVAVDSEPVVNPQPGWLRQRLERSR